MQTTVYTTVTQYNMVAFNLTVNEVPSLARSEAAADACARLRLFLTTAQPGKVTLRRVTCRGSLNF